MQLANNISTKVPQQANSQCDPFSSRFSIQPSVSWPSQLLYVGHPAIATECWGVDYSTYPKRQFRAGTIADLGHAGEKEVKMTFEDGRFFSSPVTLHLSPSLAWPDPGARHAIMHQHTVADLVPTNLPLPNLIQPNPIQLHVTRNFSLKILSTLTFVIHWIAIF
jgi:hypothetical protein